MPKAKSCTQYIWNRKCRTNSGDPQIYPLMSALLPIPQLLFQIASVHHHHLSTPRLKFFISRVKLFRWQVVPNVFLSDPTHVIQRLYIRILSYTIHNIHILCALAKANWFALTCSFTELAAHKTFVK